MARLFKPVSQRPDLEALVKKAIAKADAMAPHDYLSMLAVQHLSTTLGEGVADACENASATGRLECVESAKHLLGLYERGIDGNYSRELGVVVAGMLALLTDGDRTVLRKSIYEKRMLLDKVTVPA